MITKFDCGDIVSVWHKASEVHGAITLIASTEDENIYEVFLEKPIYNQEKLWYPENRITLKRKKKKGGGFHERFGQT